MLRHHNNPAWPPAPVTPVPTGSRGAGAVSWPRVLVEPHEGKHVEVIVPQPLTLNQMLELLGHLAPRVATVEDLRRVLKPFLDAKQLPPESVEVKLRELISLFNSAPIGESVEERLRKLLRGWERGGLRGASVEERLREVLGSFPRPRSESSAEAKLRKLLHDYGEECN